MPFGRCTVLRGTKKRRNARNCAGRSGFVTESVAARVDEEIYDYLNSEAQRQDVTVSELVRTVLESYARSDTSLEPDRDETIHHRVARLEKAFQIETEYRQTEDGQLAEIVTFGFPYQDRHRAVIKPGDE